MSDRFHVIRLLHVHIFKKPKRPPVGSFGEQSGDERQSVRDQMVESKCPYQPAKGDDLPDPFLKFNFDFELPSVHSIPTSRQEKKALLESSTEQRPQTFTESDGIKDEDPPYYPQLAHRIPFLRRLHGWRLGAVSAALLALISLVINVIAASWLASHPSDDGSLVHIFTGSCGKVAQIDMWVHLAINGVSTLLLGGSNYCMQVLCAPTRSDVNRQHMQSRFLDVGVPSVRNLRKVGTSKCALWWILALSSVPLHLMFVASRNHRRSSDIS